MAQENKFGWWGKFESFDDPDREPTMIWVGPMCREDMLYQFEQFRHNYSAVAPNSLEQNSDSPASPVQQPNGASPTELEIAAKCVIRAYDLGYGKDSFEPNIKRLRAALQLHH